MGLACFILFGVPLICGLAALTLGLFGLVVYALILIFLKLQDISSILGWAFVIALFAGIFILEQNGINIIFDVLFVAARFVTGIAINIAKFFLSL